MHVECKRLLFKFYFENTYQRVGINMSTYHVFKLYYRGPLDVVRESVGPRLRVHFLRDTTINENK